MNKAVLLNLMRKFKSKRAVSIFMLMLILSGIISGIVVFPFFLKNRDIPVKEEMNRDIEIAGVALSEIEDSIEVSGQVVFREKVNLSSKVSGRISKISVREGQRVRRGEVIAQMERLNLEISLKQQKAELEIAESGLDLARAKYGDAQKSVEIKLRTIEKARVEVEDCRVSFDNADNILKNKETLFKAGGVSETELRAMRAQHMTSRTKYDLAKADLEIQKVGYRDSDIRDAGLLPPSSEKSKKAILKKLNTRIEKAELDTARARVSQARNNIISTRLMLRETRIVSPITGVVAARNMETGEMVTEDSVIATVIDISTVFVSMNINERDIPGMKKGQRVSFTADALGKKEFHGKIDLISPVLDTKTRTVEVRSPVDNQKMILLPGMFVRARIDRGVKIRGILIPRGALTGRDSLEVYVIRKGLVMKERVVTGREIDGKIEIREGLREGDRIVVKGQSTVYEGMKAPAES